MDVAGPDGGLTLVSEDVDRFFWLHPSGEWLVHFCQRVIHQPEGGWEARTTVGLGVGRHVYHHVLIPHSAQTDKSELVRRAEQVRRPVLARPVRLDGEGAAKSWLAVRPDTVRMSALYRAGGSVVLRLYNPDAKPIETEVDLPAKPRTAELVDFHLHRIGDGVSVKGNMVQLRLRPWQIATVRLAF